MQRKLMVFGLACVTAISVAGCSRDNDPKLLNIKSNGTGPDEFAILPNKPLTLPEDFAALPEPTPGGTNRTDAAPLDDAIIALGGNPNAGGSSPGLISYATRYGVSPTIRTELAKEDLEYRRDNDGRVLERLFNVNVYFKAYAAQSLDQYGELERLRARGVRTVSAPPEPIE